MFDRIVPCPCGSGLDGEIQYDGRGIYLCRTCENCYEDRMAGFNPVILNYYTQTDVDEQIEEDE